MTDLDYIQVRAGKEGYRAQNIEFDYEEKLAKLVFGSAVSGDIEDIHQQLDLYLDTTLQLLNQTESEATNSQDRLYRFWLHCLEQHFIFDVEDSITSDTNTQLYFKRFKKSLKPTPKITVSEWADKNRILPQKASAEPGPWRTARTPYLKEIMDLLSADNETKHVVFMKGAQVGGTEAGNNWIGYTIHHAPCTMMMVLPTLETAKRTSKHRIAPMIEDTPVLDELVKDSRSRDAGNTILNKDFPNGTLIITGANSAVGLRSTPAKYLFMDEIDGYESDIDGEGDPVNLAIKRTSTFSKNRKILMVSTPTMKGVSRIEKSFQESDRRKYHIPCPVCKHMQPIAWSRLEWHKDNHNEVKLQCIECETLISENKKTWMLENGSWVAETDSEQNIAGFHLSSLYSPLGWYSWSDAVNDYLAAKDDPSLLKTWVNTVLGETYEDESTQVDANMLYYRRESYEAEVPKEVLVITAGVDIQGDRIEAEAVGWSQDKESWSIDYRIFFGDPDQPEVWNELDEWLAREWKHATNHRLQIQAACIDSGGHHTQNVYSFCKFRQRRRVFAIKGVAGFGRAIVSSPSKKRSGTERRPVPLFTVGVDTTKEIHYSRLLKTEAGPGYCHFPNQEPPYSEQFFEQLTAEKLVTKKAHGIPKPVWELPSGKRNEALDCRVYAIAALELLRPDFAKWQEHLETEAMTDKQREYFKNRKKVIAKFSQNRCRARTGWMADVLGGPAFPDYK